MINQNPNSDYSIGLYVRNSDVKQDTQEGTIKNQEQRLREFVQLRNLSGNFGKVVGVYIDRSLSGKNMQRPALQKLMSDVVEKRVDLILVSELSRISRNMRDFLGFWDLLKEHKCSFSSLRENVDTSNAAGEMVLRTIVNIAQFEREQTRERIVASTQARSKRGLYNGGSIPFGYNIIKDKPGYLEVIPEEAAIVNKAFDAFLKIGTLNATAKWLNENNIKPNKIVRGGQRARTGHFHYGNLHYILRNKAYKGAKTYKDGENWAESQAVWEAIISPEKFDQVQEILSKNYRRKKPFTKTRWPYTLSGLIYCLKCQNVLCGKSAHGRSQKYGYYEHGWASRRGSVLVKDALKCSPHRVSAEKLEVVVNDSIKKLFTNEGFAQSLMARAHRLHQNDSSQRELARLKKIASGCEGHETALTARLAELPLNVSAATIYKQLAEIQKAREEAENSILILEVKSQHKGAAPAKFEAYKAFLATIERGFKESSLAEWRSVLINQLIHRIEIGEDRVKIHYHAGQKWIEMGLEGKKKPSHPTFLKNIGSRTLQNGGPERDRTADLYTASVALSQLSYGPLLNLQYTAYL